MMWDARPSIRLRKYLERELGVFEWHEIVKAEQEAFYSHYLSEFTSTNEFHAAVFAHRSFDNRSFYRRREQTFSEIERSPRHQEPPKTYGHLRPSAVARATGKANKPAHVGDLFAKLM